ncbi:hypothetical protein FB009_103200 [Sinorhizobium medicae]|nr:hypothetical protein CN180_03710 [Sinorhizobium medicae]RVQ61631.1 hypothetical protein CN244_27205 [Sinorhizobium medicae]TWA42571.1 hypothetical protein FB009_103200 [Sinorhizobium medicae]
MSTIPIIPARMVAAFCLLLGAAVPAAADEYYEGIDINQRQIDGKRQPINTYLLKRRAATKEPPPSSTGSVPKPAPAAREPTPTVRP